MGGHWVVLRFGLGVDFGRFSERRGLNWVKSKADRSCARKCSTCVSVVSVGTEMTGGSCIACDSKLSRSW